ncbi:MAG TPA: hypothetical protein VLV16_06930 [Gemmatimonadales bacterium]|nr:hypothetical protein [Gemmatimonadales bacterium]
MKEVWVFRIVHQDSGKPAQGVPVTVLDETGNPAGYWVSESDGTVAIPRREGARLRLRVGLRNEEPIELATATLRDGPTDLAAPSWVPLTPTGGDREHAAPPGGGRPAEPQEIPGHILYFQRLAMFADRAGRAAPGANDTIADFSALPPEPSATMRYGVLVEVEQLWQSLGVLWGELLYSVSLTPGDEARLTVLDGRWRRDVEGRERPLQILARMVGTSMLGDLVSALRPELQLEGCTLPGVDLHAAATDTVALIKERTERMSQALRRRPLGVVDAGSVPPDAGALRTVRNTARDHVVTFHFFEPLERFRVVFRSPRVRLVLFVPFRMQNVATPEAVRRFGYIFRRTLIDRDLLPDLERLIGGADDGHRRLLDHIEANLLYYSTAIVAAGDPAARHAALSKLRDPTGALLTDVVENTVIGRIGSSIALPLRPSAAVPVEWREAIAGYESRPPRVADECTVTIPHPGVWVTAQPHEPMQQAGAASAAG